MPVDHKREVFRLADIQEICSDTSPCQGLKLAMDANVIQKIDGSVEDAVWMADGFVDPEDRFFFALITQETIAGDSIDAQMPLECCPFCSDAAFIANV